jgi:hypothetical protein
MVSLLLTNEINRNKTMKNWSQNQPDRKMKRYLGLVLFFILSLSGFSQNAGISASGAVPPNAAAGLDIDFSNLGLLIPRIALTNTSSSLPLAAHVAGMVIYNTATAGDVVPGFYFNNGSGWVASVPKANANGEMQYWDGTKWLAIPAGQPGQLLQINSSGVPAWTGAGYAIIATTSLSGITSTTAVSGGNITGDGGSPVTARGVCWSVTPNPVITGSHTSDGTGTGTFTSNLTGLITGTIYYIRSYATNSTGTSYGNQLVFITL